MAVRPSQHWRDNFADDYTESFLRAVDAVLATFEAEAHAADSVPQALAAVERAVLALNEVASLPGGSIDTDEREQLCLFIERC